jgi:MFS family permease
MTEILLLQTIYSLTIVFLEIPTGAFGDYFGKKKSIAIGAFIFFIGMAVYSAGSNFEVFLIAELISGIGSSLISGSDSALIYNTLKSAKKEKDYKKVEGRANSFLLMGFLLAGLLGGYIGKQSLRLTLVCSAISALIVFIISLFFKEPRIKGDEEKESYKHLIQDSIRIIRQKKSLLWIFFYSSILTAFAYILSWYYQPYFLSLNIDVVYYGWLYALFGLVAIISSIYSHHIEKFFGNIGSFILLALLIIIPSIFLGTSASILVISIFAFHQIYMGISKVIFNDRILSTIPSSKASTIISVNNLGNRLAFALLGPVFGYLTDTYSLKITLLSMGLILFVISCVMIPAFFIIQRTITKSECSRI